MSFFYGIKKYLKETLFLWLFSCFLVFSCILIHQFEKNSPNENEFTIYTYHSDFTNNHLDLIENKSDAETIAVLSNGIGVNELHAKYAVLMDADNGRVLYEKNGDEKVPMASTTKIMTLIIVLENANLDDMVTVSSNAAKQPDVQLNIKENEQYRLRDLLYSLMLESHNDSAVAIAEHVGGSVEGFAKMMNDKAAMLGAYQTHFVTPNGLDSEEHYTTAKDLALIAKYAIENEEFCKIINTRNYTFYEQTTGRSFTVNNKNKFLDSYDGAIGIKTGFTGNAGYCFVGAVKKEEKTLISVVLASGWPPDKNFKWDDTTKLMNYGMSEYSKKTIMEAGISFQSITVEDGIDCKSITPYVKEDVELLLNDKEEITYDVKVINSIKAPVKKNQKVGNVTISIDGEKYKVIPLYSDKGCDAISYPYYLKKILYRYLGFSLN